MFVTTGRFHSHYLEDPEKNHSLFRGVGQRLLAFDSSDGAGYGRADFEQGSLERRKRRAIVMKDTAGNDDGIDSLNTIGQEEVSG
jgi:hypothetical protein